MENYLAKHYEQLLKKNIEDKKGEKIGEGILPILENLYVLAEKIDGGNGETKMFLKTQVKQMLFFILYPTGRISAPSYIIKDAWTEVTMSVFADKDDVNPIGTYTSIGIYDNILQQVSKLEKIKCSIEMATGAALSRALTRAGIGLEFFSDLELEELVMLSSTSSEEKTEEQTENNLDNALKTPTFQTPESMPTTTPEPTPEQEPVSTSESSPAPVETAEQTVSEHNENVSQPPVKKGRKKKSEDTQQLSFVKETSVPEMTLEEAYQTKADIAPYIGKTLQEMVEMNKQHQIWMLQFKTPNEAVKKAIAIVVNDLCEKDESFKQYVESKQR